MKKLIILDQEPLTPRREQVFNIAELIASGYVVEFWDLSGYCFNVSIAHTIEREYVRQFTTQKEIREAFDRENLNHTLFIFEGYLAKIKPQLNNYLRRRGATTLCYEINTTSAGFSYTLGRKIKTVLTKHPFSLPILIGRKIRFVIRRRMNKPYSYTLSSGTILPADFQVNHSDYELYLKALQKPESPVAGRYIVFLDDYFPYHPDFVSHGVDLLHHVGPYFRDMNVFFSRLERQYGMPVVIAAHPKANYTSETFGDRMILIGQSIKLVQGATCVIAKASASIGFAIMFHKPLLLITTDDILQDRNRMLAGQVDYQQSVARLLGTSIVNISQSDRMASIDIRPTDAAVRQQYLYRFHTSPGIENTLNIDILPGIFNRI